MAFDHSSDSRIGQGSLKSARGKLTGLRQYCRRMTGKLEITADDLSAVSFNSAGPYFPIAPLMRCSNIVWVVVSPSSSHPFGILMIGNDVVVVGELFVADRTYSSLLADLAV